MMKHNHPDICKMGKLEQVHRLLESGPKRVDEIRKAVPRLHWPILDEAKQSGLFEVTDGLWHLPTTEVRSVSVEESVNDLNRRVTEIEKQLKAK